MTPIPSQAEPQEELEEEEEEVLPASTDGTLRGPPTGVKHGDLTLTIFVEKVRA